MKDFLVISDVHGCFSLLEAAMQDWNPETHKLMFLGDYTDRGPQSLEVIKMLQQLKLEYPDDVEILMGNHDEMFLDFVQNPQGETSDTFLEHGGIQTLESFFGKDFIDLKDPEVIRGRVTDRIHLLTFMTHFKPFHEEEHIIFVHAGFYMPFGEEHFTHRNSWNQYLWMRKVHQQLNTTGKTVVFGHTPVRSLNPKKAPVQPYVNEENRYIGVDGGAVFENGALLAVEVSYEGKMEGYKKYE